MEETLVVGKFGELSAKNYLWQNKIWRIAVWSAPHAIKFWNSVTCIHFTYIAM